MQKECEKDHIRTQICINYVVLVKQYFVTIYWFTERFLWINALESLDM